jgi:hypothetical protein
LTEVNETAALNENPNETDKPPVNPVVQLQTAATEKANNKGE